MKNKINQTFEDDGGQLLDVDLVEGASPSVEGRQHRGQDDLHIDASMSASDGLVHKLEKSKDIYVLVEDLPQCINLGRVKY